MKRRSMKRLVILCAVLVMAFASIGVSAKTTYKSGKKVKTYKGSFYTVYYNNKAVSNPSCPAIMLNKTIMVPYNTALVMNGPKLRSALQKNTLTLASGNNWVRFVIGKKYMYVNGKKKKIKTAPVYANVNGMTYYMVPANNVCANLGFNYGLNSATKSYYIAPPAPTPAATTGLQATSFMTMNVAQFISVMGPIAKADYLRTGVLASVTLAQAINESGWGKSSLTQQSNNMFGMKISLSGNTWAGSQWDGRSYVTVSTVEQVGKKKVTTTAKFRKYASVSQSIGDHSAYLANAKNGSQNRYAGLLLTNNYATQLTILQRGGYCSWSSYVTELSNLIKRYNLTAYDR